MKYLEVSFGDNDFGNPVREALSRLWSFVTDNNAHLSQKPIADLFVYLHHKKMLSELLARLVDAEYLAGEVEHCTRGIYSRVNDENDDFPLTQLPERTDHPGLESLTERYLHLTIKFHDADSFSREGDNGESAYLNLVSGDVVVF